MNTNSPVANERSDLDWIADAWQDIHDRSEVDSRSDTFDENGTADN